MHTVNEKIMAFLREAGYNVDQSASAGLQLLRFFETEYGVEIMGMLESEWFEEQADLTLAASDFEGLRDQIDNRRHEEFDEALDRLFTLP